MAYACRLCRKSLTALDGCSFCLPVKTNLVTTEENDEESASLADVSNQTVSALRAILRRHRDILRDTKTESKDKDRSEETIIKLGNTVAKALDSARKLQEDAVAAIANMSFVERAALFISWYTALPATYRKQVRDGMDKFELSLSVPKETKKELSNGN